MFPEKSSTFIIKKGEKGEVAWLNKDGLSFQNVASSYEACALVLFDKALSEPETIDYIIYPAFFIMRHYLELRLKELVVGLEYCANDKENVLFKEHKLLPLWYKVVELYGKTDEPNKEEEFKAMTKLMGEIRDIDNTSFVFRYPHDIDGNQSQTLDYINVKNLKDVFIQCAYFLNSLSMQINELKKHKDEMNNYYK